MATHEVGLGKVDSKTDRLTKWLRDGWTREAKSDPMPADVALQLEEALHERWAPRWGLFTDDVATWKTRLGEPDGASEWYDIQRVHHVEFDAEEWTMTLDVSIVREDGLPLVDPYPGGVIHVPVSWRRGHRKDRSRKRPPPGAGPLV